VSTKVDAVLLALVTLWGVAPALEGVEVADGPQANSEALNEWLFVGADGVPQSEGTQFVSAQQEWQAFARVKRESAEITCAFLVRSGEKDTVSLRARAYALLGAAEDAVRADPTLAGLVMQAGISAHQYFPTATTGGSMARVVFTVTYMAQL
jgi:hypothetical protein